MAYTYTTIDGERVETAVARAYAALEAEFRRVWNLDLLVSSGTRTYQEQAILYQKWLNGTGNLAAKPGMSNHEEGGPRGPRALDVRDSGADAGVTVINSPRSIWLKNNCGRFGFVNAGYGFKPQEAWHIEYQGNLDNGAVPAGNGAIAVDGDWGAATTSKLQAALGVTVDGAMGPETISALQRGLGVTVDGAMGPETISALQSKVGATVDGQLGPNTVRALQIFLNAGGRFAPATGTLQVDGQWGAATTRAFQHSLSVNEDGQLGPATWSAFQRAVGITDDGQPGSDTYKALQMNVGATVDGALGQQTVAKLQEHLNAGKGWVKVTLPAAPAATPATPRTTSAPFEARAWHVPLSNSIATGAPNVRPDGVVVNRLIVHHTAATNDQEEYFKTKNDRTSCPTWYVNDKAEIIGLIEPNLKPSSTGAANAYSVAVEVENTSGGPTWGISEAQHEAVSTIAAWLAKQTSFGGIPFDIKLDRTHVIGHNEAGVNATACPGPSMNLNEIVVRANEINKTAPVVVPDPEPTLNDKIKVLYVELGKLIDTLE